MRKKRAKRGLRPQTTPSSPGDVTPDYLIEPSILRIAGFLKSGTLTAEEMAKPIAGTGWARVPPELRPFIESLALSRLAEILRTRPGLYWHPLVERQVAYLRRLRHDPKEWERLEWNDTYGIGRPKEVARVSEALRTLVEAHAGGLFPYTRIAWKAQARKSGPRGRIKNPHSVEPWTEWVDALWLDKDERDLRKVFRRRHEELSRRPGDVHNKEKPKARITTLVMEALEVTDACWWSGLKEYKEIPRHGQVMPSPPLSDDFDTPISTDIVVEWKPLDLSTATEAMLSRKMGRAGRDGKPAYLAYATLGLLLAVPPERIKDALDNFRRPRRKKQR